MNKVWRKLDNTAKAFSVEEKNNYNTFRLSAILKEKVDLNILKSAVIQAIDTYPSYKVKIKTGFFWNYFEENEKEIIVSEENDVLCKNFHLNNNNDYLFKVTCFHNKINLDMFHILTDGLGGITFLKSILYNYLNLKYHLKTSEKEIIKIESPIHDQYLKNVDQKLICREKYKKAFVIQEKSNILKNKTYHYILDLKKLKNICKEKNVSITEYLTAIYIYAIYNTIYDKTSKKDITVTVPIDLRKYYHVQTFSNFFTCMCIDSNVVGKKIISFDELLNQVHKEFKDKLVLEKVKTYLSRDVKLGTNIGIRLVPLFFKKLFMKYLGKFVNQSSTTTFSNIHSIQLEEQYKKYVDNIMALVNTGKIQKVKCTVCSYENNLTITLNSNLISNRLEEEFYNLLEKYIGKVKLQKI